MTTDQLLHGDWSPCKCQKAQFLAAHEMGHIINKFKGQEMNRFFFASEEARSAIIIWWSIHWILELWSVWMSCIFRCYPLSPNSRWRSHSAGGRGQTVFDLMLAGIAKGLADYFLNAPIRWSKMRRPICSTTWKNLNFLPEQSDWRSDQGIGWGWVE